MFTELSKNSKGPQLWFIAAIFGVADSPRKSSFSPDKIWRVCEDGGISIWNLETNQQTLSVLCGETPPILVASVSAKVIRLYEMGGTNSRAQDFSSDRKAPDCPKGGCHRERQWNQLDHFESGRVSGCSMPSFVELSTFPSME